VSILRLYILEKKLHMQLSELYNFVFLAEGVPQGVAGAQVQASGE